MYNRKDYYYKRAKEEGRASRASYKLEQIQSKFHIIKKGDRVLDFGCAPGSWLEMISEIVGEKGVVVGIDLLPVKINLGKNIVYIQGDIGDTNVQGAILKAINGKVDVVVSDMAPNTSGVIFRDSYLSYELATMALEMARKVLRPGGNFATKVFQGEEVPKLKSALKKSFRGVETLIPPATRQSSKELYLIGRTFII